MKSLMMWSVLAMLAGGIAVGADRLPQDAKPLSQVLKSLEQQGVKPIVEAALDDGVWEVEGFRGEKAVEMDVDPVSLKILREHPDREARKPNKDAKSAPEIVSILEKGGYSPVLEIDWEGDYWEVEAIHSGSFRELRVDAATGKILGDRPEDD